MKAKVLSILALLLTAVTGAWTQTTPQIPNGDFETWTYDGEKLPNNWNSYQTADGNVASIVNSVTPKRSTDVRPGSTGQYSCSISAKSLLGVVYVGNLTSGRVRVGSMSASSADNYNYSDRDGSNTKNDIVNPCAMTFTGKPKAIKVWVKYVQGGTGYGNYTTAKFSAFIHADGDYIAYNDPSHDKDNNSVLLVASAVKEIAYNNGEWEELTIPFEYTENDVEPAYILINAYTNANPSKGKANDCLYIDDIEMVYETESPAATQYDLTLADGSDAHGTVAFTVGGAAATQAKKDDVVTVTVTPAEGYSTKNVTVRAYTTWAAAPARGMNRAPELVDNIAVTPGENGTWSFTMPEANVWVVVAYTKNLQDAWIEAIVDQTYTGEAIEPIVTVKDGETTLTAGTDYTVAYSDNTVAGTATVTITAVDGSDYSGTASATFTIAKADITMTTAPAAIEGLIYSGEALTLVTAGVASFGTVLYSTDGETYDEALPQKTEAGTYTVYYKVEGDANHNAFGPENVNVTIATNKTALNTAISDAEAYYETIKETNPDAAAVLKDAIDEAKDVQGNADATQTEIETATQALNDAVAAAQADVALKRIAITIPAKSYVARVDADKRQIEVAVAGVSLYSVKSVTDSEVELTAELSVIAAEMPYLIYNDNDEEVTVNIVVSSSEADDVAYDSEHFKGTLVDKTFTDEDMQAADHYVLSGQNFVWVKDAGTLAAGKCWIELVPQSAAHARRLSIVHEGGTTPTGINAVSSAAANEDGEWYDLSGRRIAQPAKGIYVKNGRKVVIK